MRDRRHQIAQHPVRRRRVRSVAGLAVAMGTGVLLAGVAAAGNDDVDPPVTLTIGVIQDLDSPNVTAGVLVSSYELWTLQYATLTDKAAADFATTPGLAESWDRSEDGLTYTYHLRDGLLWSDGQPLTADDVVFTINTSRDQEWLNHSSTTVNLEAKALDAQTVQITSSVPDPKLPTMDVYILPKHIWEAQAAGDITTYAALDGVGSGPFTLSEWQSGQSWTMVANPNHWRGKPAIDRLVFRVFTNSDAMVAALQSGEIDATNNVPSERFDELQEDPNIEAVVGNQGSMVEFAMNGMAGGLGDGNVALQDIDFRHAVAHAIDRSVLFDRVLLGKGLANHTLSVSPSPEWTPEIPAEQRYDYDPEEAKRLLDAGGYVDTDGNGVRELPGGGDDIVLRYAERSESDIAASVREFITGWLDAVGIGTEVSVFDDDQLTTVLASGEYDLFVWGWTPFVDPDPILSYFTCAQLTTNIESIGYNDANWCDEEYDALYEQQKVELDRTKRVDLVHQMLALFYERSTYIVLFHDADLQAYRTDRFAGWVRQPAETGPVIFTNSSPSYFLLQPLEGAGEADDGMSTGVIIGIIAGVVVVLGVGAFLVLRSRRGREDRE